MEKKRNPWSWVPTLYFAEGFPYVAIVTMSVVMYKNLGMSNTDIAFYTSWFYLPWVIKPLWSPFVDILKTKRWWITRTQLFMGAGFLFIAFCLPSRYYLPASIIIFWVLAFSSASHDIAADGFYLLGLNKKDQSFFVGIRNTFYRLAMITGQGLLIYFAGTMEKRTDNVSLAWAATFALLAFVILSLWLYHRTMLPYPASDQSSTPMNGKAVLSEFTRTFAGFFSKKGAKAAILFLLTYRFSEAQLLKLIQPFMLDPLEKGGLGLDTSDVGIIYGVYGVIGLLVGGILGGILISRGGLRKWLWPMMLTMLITSIVFVYLSYVQPSNWYIINLCVLVEQFGYGFGFTAYTVFMLRFSEGNHKTAFYALCTGFMALGMMLPGMAAGRIYELLGGYREFFVYVMVCSIVPIIGAMFIKVEKD